MDDMVERVARAIQEAVGDGDADMEASKAYCRKIARAAIAAMREWEQESAERLFWNASRNADPRPPEPQPPSE